jgi:rod shape-determining protein MreC
VVAIVSFWDERKLLVFLALIIAAAALMSAEISAARAGQRSLNDELVATLVTPIEGAVVRTENAVTGEVNLLLHAGALARENEALRRKVQQLASANERLKEDAIENVHLRRMLGIAPSLPQRTLAADVIGYAPEGAREEITIDRGTRDGVRRDDVVVNGDGLIGHVIDAGPHDAHVLLVTDPTSAVPAFLRDAHSWGIATGTTQHVRVKYIGQDVRVRAGDVVVTGRSDLYPPGIRIGTVSEVDRRDNALYQSAVVQPAVQVSGLTHVLVLLR